MKVAMDVLYPLLFRQIGYILQPAVVHPEEKELDHMHMDRLLAWMGLVFDMTEHNEYKQELFSLYRTICSNYRQYQQWQAYNRRLWILSVYRKKDTARLAHTILMDVRLFKEGIHLLSILPRDPSYLDDTSVRNG